MKLSELISEARPPREKAGCIPYIMQDGEPLMAFMISSDSMYGGPDPMIAKGGVDPGENAEQAGVREAEEELGLKKSNIVSGTLKLGWSGELTGLDAHYKMSVFVCEVKDKKDFNKPHYETKEVKWLTLEQFNKIGRKSQRHIVNAVIDSLK